ncbi:ABC transporter substrate-binding protein [Desertimonas flava]|uniref:ABC transporter substrate-binding protein n=1 Tax=Desertimonas flava TaxID=2064846 RepID=UPI000E34318D|nr:ABC transporter substrate-binding protein [Desertimonas flava]
MLRRSRLVAATALAVAVVAPASAAAVSATSVPPGSRAESPAAESPATVVDGVWSYTDGSGRTTTLDEVPERIVMHSGAAAALIPLGIRPVAVFADDNVDADPYLRGVDLEGIEIVGEEWGVINLEAVAALEPDLVIAEYWPVEDGYSGMEESTGNGYELMTDIAPVVGPAQGPSVVAMIEDFENLAVSLGADLDAADLAGERVRFEAAVAAFSAAVEAKPGLTVLAVAPTTEGLYVAVPENAAELADFMSWGLDIVVPDPDPEFPYWQQLSWEQADLYQADVIIVDDRSPESIDVAEEQPTWDLLDAVRAGAVADWPAFRLRNYSAYADALEALTGVIDAADPDLVD